MSLGVDHAFVKDKAILLHAGDGAKAFGGGMS